MAPQFKINDIVRMTKYGDSDRFVVDEPYVVIRTYSHGCAVSRMNGLPLSVGPWCGHNEIHFVPWALRKDEFLTGAWKACKDG